ncbi:MAG: dockerin type I repeat-containing protein [Clostridia bacterium]|nr:dockerin type I repeat-containing protein [Clostridia bacterium]
MKKLIPALCALMICLAACVTAFAYNSPFDTPDPAVPGEAGEACDVEYSLRAGGTFIYNNNPEALKAFNLGKALMIENDLHGDVYFTCENQNRTGKAILLGLQLRNDSGEDITVTVHNVGYQVGGDWVGQREWTDFFDTKFEIELPKANSYGFDSVMDPRGFKAKSYVIPNGKYIYVMGGSTADSYNNINVGGTANKYAAVGQCVNGAVYFTVEGPKTGVSAAFVCYDPSSTGCVTSRAQQGYVVEKDGDAYGRQYLGSAPALCAQASFAWNVNDSVADHTRLPVKYKVTYFDDCASYGNYGEYKNPKTNTVKGSVWYTHLNSANHNTYVGTDMMPFYCVTDKGEDVVIDVYHNDGTSKPANIGNWMVVYEESFTFKNSGVTTRTFTLYMENNGVLAVNVRNKNGDLIQSLYHHDKSVPVYTLTVAPYHTGTFVLEYVLCANSYGNVAHYVTTGTVPQVKWDYNNSGVITSDDAIYLLRYTLFPDQFPVTQSGDVNGDGSVDSDDAIRLLRFLLFGE